MPAHTPQPALGTQALHLIETMRAEAGGICRLNAHLARLAQSAQALGFRCDTNAAAATAERALREAAAETPHGTSTVWRVRLALYANGEVKTQVRELAPNPSRLVAWSTQALDEDAPARRHKSSDRALYDAATRWAQQHGFADVIFVGRRGQVAEGAISNVFVRGSDGVYKTPPVADGALPGVLRAELLARGEAVEATLTPAMLRGGELFIGNALRGLRAVTLVETPAFTLASA